jgi:hypothetical protein
MTFADLVPGPHDRVFLAGKTGSGKSFAARLLLEWANHNGRLVRRRHVLVYDAKGLLRWPGYHRVTRFERLFSAAQSPARYPRLIYAPRAEELRDSALHEAFFRLAYERRNTTVYVDEVYAVVNGTEYPSSYHAILTRGREMNVPLFSATQRPKDLPQAIISESSCFYLFRLLLPQDRKKMAEVVPIDPDALRDVPDEHFWFYRDGQSRAVGPLRLQVGQQEHTSGRALSQVAM